MHRLFIGNKSPTIKLKPEAFSCADALVKHLTTHGIKPPKHLDFCINAFDYCSRFAAKPDEVLFGDFTNIVKSDLDDLIMCCAQPLFSGMSMVVGEGDFGDKGAAILKIPLLVALLRREVGHPDCYIFL